ncbi:hypothetical protein MRS44_016943 [Fusarium solani]|uniref:uncharacterized protein n=1 Tax=Fusarium solani TaxID=169388 RepID=UPI0032C48E6C|nr:hypothetical protein MRS44_016943 [Fusarium solani]
MDFFLVEVDANDSPLNPYWACRLCDAKGQPEFFAAAATSSAADHLRKSHRIFESSQRADTDPSTDDYDRPKRPRLQYSAVPRAKVKMIRELSLGLLINTDVPFSFFTDLFFKQLAWQLDPHLSGQVPWSRQSMSRLLDDMYKSKKDKVKQELLDALTKIHLGFDLRTSPNRHAIMAVTAHFLDHQAKHQSRLLALRRQLGCHSGGNLAVTLSRVIREFEIEGRVGTVISDNVSSNDNCLQNFYGSLNVEMGPAEIRARRMRCYGHILNLCGVFKQWVKNRTAKTTAMSSELERYLRLEPQEIEDPIEWWMARQGQFPMVSQLALDILAIPAMATDCERSFSLAKLTLMSQRLLMTTETLEKLQCLKNWVRHGAVKLGPTAGGRDELQWEIVNSASSAIKYPKYDPGFDLFDLRAALCARHNHPPSEDPSAHPAHRRFEEQDAATISNLAISGTTPRDIRTYLHTHSETLATQRHIYNRIAETRRDLREGQSSIQALVDQLHREGFWCRVRLDPDNRLTAIFFAHPDFVASLYQRELPSVILTDRCLAAMNAAAIWFSSSKALLCLWHVNKAVLQHCRPFFASKVGQATEQAEGKAWDEFYAFWHSIVASPDEKSFEERLAKFELRAEGIHSLIESHIKTSSFDLFDVWRAMKHAITNQLKGLKHMRASQQVRTPLEASGILFEAVRGWVSHQALRKVQEQRQLLQKQHNAPCSQTFTSSHELPCSHTLAKLEEERQTLLLEHFHPHWHLKRDVAQPRPMLEPRRATNQPNQRDSQPTTSNRREPSGFEPAEARKRAPSKCSRCHTVGHTMASRACPLRFKELPTQAAQAPNSVPHASVALQAPMSDAILEFPTEANQRSPSVAHTLLVRSPPPILDSPIAPHNPVIPGYSTGILPRSASEGSPVEEAALLRNPPCNHRHDYKQMSKRCITSTGSREWTKEEMMAYLDWSKAEDERMEAQVAKEMGDNPLTNKRRGVKEIWKSVERDSKE